MSRELKPLSASENAKASRKRGRSSWYHRPAGSSLIVDDDPPSLVRLPPFFSARNPWDEAGGRLDLPLQPSKEMFLGTQAFEQRPDAPHRALVSEPDRGPHEFRRQC